MGQICCATGNGNQGCCPSGTSCTNDQGCCPLGKMCSDGPVCYNNLDPKCLNATERLCCPASKVISKISRLFLHVTQASAPFCRRNVPGYGTGCFGNDSSTANSSISSSFFRGPISRVYSTNSTSPLTTGSASSIPTKILLDTSGIISLPPLATGASEAVTFNAPSLCWNTNSQKWTPCTTGQTTSLRGASTANDSKNILSITVGLSLVLLGG